MFWEILEKHKKNFQKVWNKFYENFVKPMKLKIDNKDSRNELLKKYCGNFEKILRRNFGKILRMLNFK